MLKKAVIAAGGFGTRLASEYPGIPKALVPVLGKPLLQRQLESLKENCIDEIFITLGYQAGAIQEFLASMNFGIDIRCHVEKEPLGTAGALYFLKDRINEDFFFCMGDILFDIDLKRLSAFHNAKNALATLVVHPNSHPYDSDIVVMDNDNKVTGLISKKGSRPELYSNLVNAGVYVFSPLLLQRFTKPEKLDLEKEVIAPMIASNVAVYGYRTTEYLKDAGTPDRIRQVENELSSGTVAAKNLKNRQKAVFLDRDGTINRHRGLISHHRGIELEKHAAEAVRMINRSRYLAIVVTNQPVIARNLCDFEDLNKIHQKIEVLLGNEGAYLDDIFFCPHHPDWGYPEERKEYKLQCSCRKPSTGMIEQAAAAYNLELGRSWIIGDSTSDIQAGINAGLKTILVGTGFAGKDCKYTVHPDFKAENLVDAVKYIYESGEA